MLSFSCFLPLTCPLRKTYLLFCTEILRCRNPWWTLLTRSKWWRMRARWLNSTWRQLQLKSWTSKSLSRYIHEETITYTHLLFTSMSSFLRVINVLASPRDLNPGMCVCVPVCVCVCVCACVCAGLLRGHLNTKKIKILSIFVKFLHDVDCFQGVSSIILRWVRLPVFVGITYKSALFLRVALIKAGVRRAAVIRAILREYHVFEKLPFFEIWYIASLTCILSF